MTMSGPWAYDRYQEYAAVFPKIADVLNASGVTAEVMDNKDQTGLVVKVVAAGITAVLNDDRRDNWSIDIGGQVIELDIPVQKRNAKAIAAAFLKAIGK